MPKKRKSITGQSAAFRRKIMQRLRREQETSLDREYRLSKMRARSASRRASETTAEREDRRSENRAQSAFRRVFETAVEREYRLSELRAHSASRRASETVEEREYRLDRERWVSQRRRKLQREIQAERASVQDLTEIHLPHVPNLGIVKKEPIDETGEILPTSQNIPAVQSSNTFPLSLKSEPIDYFVDDMTTPVSPDDIALLVTPIDKVESSSMFTSYACTDSTEPPPKRSNLSLSPSTSITGTEDEFSVFGDFVAAKLRSFTDRHLQAEAQHRITNLIEMNMKNLNENSLW